MIRLPQNGGVKPRNHKYFNYNSTEWGPRFGLTEGNLGDARQLGKLTSKDQHVAALMYGERQGRKPIGHPNVNRALITARR